MITIIICSISACFIAYLAGRRIQRIADRRELDQVLQNHMENIGRLGNLQKRLDSTSELCQDLEKNLAAHHAANELLRQEIQALLPKKERPGLKLVR